MTEDWEPQIEPRAASLPPTGFPVGLTIAAAIAFAILIGLGVWQLQRLKWKEALLAHIAAAEAAPAVPLEDVLDALARGHDVEFTRVTVACPGLARAPCLELYALRDGEIGSRLISACPVDSTPISSILVDRGFIPDTVTGPPAASTPWPPTPIEVIGRPAQARARQLRRRPQNRPGHWYLHDVAGPWPRR